VGHVGDSLRHPFETPESKLIKYDSKEDGRREAYKQVQKIQCNGVAQRIMEVFHAEGFFEPVKTGPGGFPYGLEHVVLLEGDHDIRHGNVAEDDKEGHGQNQHQIEHPCALKIVHAPCMPYVAFKLCLLRSRIDQTYTPLLVDKPAFFIPDPRLAQEVRVHHIAPFLSVLQLAMKPVKNRFINTVRKKIFQRLPRIDKALNILHALKMRVINMLDQRFPAF
jgi:hypothetical protein